MKYEQHLESCETLNNIWKNKSKYLIIHYACESFYEKSMAKTPRITAIAIRSFESGQTHSFSMHQTAELLNIDTSDITTKYDEIEFEMLKMFSIFLQSSKEKYWIHWNMRDGNYGFQAILHRYKILRNKFDPNGQSSPEMLEINDDNKYDLSLLLIRKYGSGYIGNPRMVMLAKENKMSMKDLLTGSEEASAFENGEFHKLLLSTLSKVTLFSNILQKTIDNDLKTQSRKSDIYDSWKIRVINYITKNPYGVIGIPITTTILGYILGKYF